MTELLKTFNNLALYKHHKRDLFTDFIDLTLSTFLEDESSYNETAKRYTKPEIKEFSQALVQLLLLGKKTQDEILSELYMRLEIANKNAGQFFTPTSISDLMAKISLGENFKGGNILDPAVGAGVTLISAVKELNSKQLNNSHFTGIDIDGLCAKMCALNFLFFNLNGVIIHGNTLTLETWKAWRTTRTFIGGSIKEVEITQEQKVQIKQAVEQQQQTMIF